MLFRSAAVWLAVRLAIASSPLPGPRFATSATLIVLAVVLLLGLIDTRRRGEYRLLANLGVGLPGIVCCWCAVPVVAELLIAFAVRP